MLFNLFVQVHVYWFWSGNRSGAGIEYWQTVASSGLILGSKLSSSPLPLTKLSGISWSFLRHAFVAFLLPAPQKLAHYFLLVLISDNCLQKIQRVFVCLFVLQMRIMASLPEFPINLDQCWLVPCTHLANDYNLPWMGPCNLHNAKYCKPECVSLWFYFLLAGRLILSNVYIAQTLDSGSISRDNGCLGCVFSPSVSTVSEPERYINS